MCSSMLSLKFLLYCKKHSANNEHRDQRMGQVVAYKRLKQSKIINRQAQKVVAVRGGHFRNFWVGMCRWDPGTLGLHQS